MPSGLTFSSDVTAEISATDDSQPGSSHTKIKISQQETTPQRLVDHSAQVNDKDQGATDEVGSDRPSTPQGNESVLTFPENFRSDRNLDPIF